MPPWCINAYSQGADLGQGRINAYGPGAELGQGRINAPPTGENGDGVL